MQYPLTIKKQNVSPLQTECSVHQTDLSLLQNIIYIIPSTFQNSGEVFKHVIINEYKDTKTIPDMLIIKLGRFRSPEQLHKKEIFPWLDLYQVA